MTNPITTFEDFLKDIHAKDYHGTDDNMPDAFEHWLCNLDGEEYMEFAEKALLHQQREMMEKEEPKKGESWRRGYQEGVKTEREMMKKEAEEIQKDLRDIILGGHNCRGGAKEGCALFEKIAPIEKRLSDFLSNKEIKL